MTWRGKGHVRGKREEEGGMEGVRAGAGTMLVGEGWRLWNGECHWKMWEEALE